MTNSANANSPEEQTVVLRLYIADRAPNSALALANLEAMCNDGFLQSHCTIEVVDILEEPQRALADGVLVTPTLTRVSPLPTGRVIGNLSDRSKVFLALGLG